MARFLDARKAIDGVSVPIVGSVTSEWFKVSNLAAVRFIEDASGVDVTYDIEGSPDDGTTVYSIVAEVTSGSIIEIADSLIRVTANNSSAISVENANCWLIPRA